MQQGSVGGAYASLIAPYLCGRKNLTQKIERYPGHPKWYKRFPVCKKTYKNYLRALVLFEGNQSISGIKALFL